jgi:hypothetical protein
MSSRLELSMEKMFNSSPILECSWSCGNSTLGGVDQSVSNILTDSNNRSSMMKSSDFGFICYMRELRMKSGRELQEYFSAHCLLRSNQQLLNIFLL